LNDKVKDKMARRPDIKKKAFIPIPKDMNKASWKII